MKLPGFNGQEWLWMHRSLKCGVEPISGICSSFSDAGFDLTQVALFKELGRAAYSNPIAERDLFFHQELNEKARTRAEASARAIRDGVHQIRECPVCGVDALVVFEDSDTEVDEDERPVCNWWKTFMVQCECCGLRLDDNLENPAEYGVAIPDFWEQRQW